MPFETNTRLKIVPIGTMTKPTGGGITSLDLPKAGILAGLLIPIRVTTSGTLGTPNALGMASVINRLVLRVNAGQTLIDVSGIALYYLMQEMLQDNYAPYNVGKNAVTIAANQVMDVFVPVALNMRDEYGLIMLQNDATLVNLSITWEQDSVVTSTGVVTATASPAMVIFESPSDQKDLPMFDTVHQMLEEQITLSSAQTYDHQIARGGILIGQYYVVPAGFTDVEFRLQQSNVIEKMSAAQHRTRYWLTTGKDANLSGTVITGEDKRIFLDWAGSDGLGQFGTTRDVVNTGLLTSIFTRITTAGATTLYSLRRQLLPAT